MDGSGRGIISDTVLHFTGWVLRNPRKCSVSQTDIVPEFRTPELYITKLSYPLSRSIRHFLYCNLSPNNFCV